MIRASRFEIQCDLTEDRARVNLTGELDLASVPRLQEAVEKLLAQGARSVIIDLGRLTFMDSSGLRLFVALSNRAAGEGWSLGLLRPPDPALTIFRITGAEQNLPFIEEPGPE